MGSEGLAGRTLAGRYDVLAALGSGGMGSVYRARDRELDEEIALKVIRSDLVDQPALLDRFRREVKLARRVTHRSVARTFELGRADDLVFCTMELVVGESLRDRLARDTRLPAEEAIAIARELCDGLAAAHAANVIHRDIKPENILIASDGRVVLADFGIAVATFAESDEIAGTLAYMAPEQARGEPATPETDVYALAVVLCEMVSGRRPFVGATEDIIQAKQATPHIELEGCGRELAVLIARATARDPRDRISSATELGRLLASLTQTPPSVPAVGVVTGFTVHTVVVLPPRVAAGAGHLALAVHEEVLARLGRLPMVRALPRRSATAEIADTIVELVAGDLVRATITRAGRPPIVLDLPLTVGELESTANAIVGAVAGSLEQPPALAAAATVAIELMLRARERLQRGFGDTAETLALLERADELLPGDPRITATLAFCEVRAAFFFDQASEERLVRARSLVRSALTTGKGRAESHLAAGHLELHLGNSVRAARHFREAIARAPHLAEAHEHLGRMLLEAGFIEVGLARLDDAPAIVPNPGAAGWDIVRARALEGRWTDSDRIASDLVRAGADRWVPRVRLAWWRRDHALLTRLYAEADDPPHGDLPIAVSAIAATILQGTWHERRDAIVATALVPTASSRRRAFNAQLAAEAAGYFGDVTTCVAMIDRAAAAGAFDLHWLDHCPVIEVARGAAIATSRAHIAQRANAILDALYGDSDSTELSATVLH